MVGVVSPSGKRNAGAGHLVCGCCGSDDIAFRGQFVGAVVAEKAEIARHAAGLVRIDYKQQPHDALMSIDRGDVYRPPSIFDILETDTSTGDGEAAIAAAALTVDETYRTLTEHNNPMEPRSTIAVWADGSLTLYDSTQGVQPGARLRAQIGVERADQRGVRSRKRQPGACGPRVRDLLTNDACERAGGAGMQSILVFWLQPQLYAGLRSLTMRKVYRGDGIEVSFDLDLCVHVGECLRGHAGVFQARRRPWILPNEADPDTVAEVVRRCPSGALQYQRLDGGEQERHEGTTVRPIRDGPLLVVGDIRVQLEDGSVETLPRATLCRCGRSKNKPFCDNQHLSTDFKAPGVPFKVHLSPVRPRLREPIDKVADPRRTA